MPNEIAALSNGGGFLFAPHSIRSPKIIAPSRGGRVVGGSSEAAGPASQPFLFDFPGHCWLLEFVDVCVAPTSNINLKIRAPQAMPTTTTTTILRMRSLVIWLLSFVVLPRPGHA